MNASCVLRELSSNTYETALAHALWFLLKGEHVLAAPSHEAESPDLQGLLEDLHGKEP